MWTVLTWILFPFFTIKYGYVGASIATLLVGSSSVVVWVLAKKIFDVNIIKTVHHPFFASILMMLVILAFQRLSPSSLTTFIGTILIGLTTFSLYNLIFCKKEIIWFWDQLKCLKNRK
jgi:hypothetical protein